MKIACEVQADVVCVVDGSTSIGNSWDLVLEFIVDLVYRLPVESGDVLVSTLGLHHTRSTGSLDRGST